MVKHKFWFLYKYFRLAEKTFFFILLLHILCPQRSLGHLKHIWKCNAILGDRQVIWNIFGNAIRSSRFSQLLSVHTILENSYHLEDGQSNSYVLEIQLCISSIILCLAEVLHMFSKLDVSNLPANSKDPPFVTLSKQTGLESPLT